MGNTLGRDMATDLIERVCSAYAWQRALGNATTRTDLAWFVRDASNPEIWSANHASQIRATTPGEIDTVLQQADAALRHCAHRMFVIDPLTPPAFTAHLALADYRELTPTLQLVLSGALRATPIALDLRPVTDEADWQSLQRLVEIDFAEGGRTHGGAHGAEIARGMVADYRSKAPAYQFFLATRDDVDCAYGAAVLCDNGMGMVEDLFTLPAFRRRGIASAIIAHAVDHVRARGAADVLIGAHVGDAPKHLYAGLGFAPVCVTREYIAHPGAMQQIPS
jgi:GNAT superfamily N-acetyltransferase